MKIVFATSEATPFIISGGLADVLGSLPKAMAAKGHESIVILPKYRDMKMGDTLEYIMAFGVNVGWRVKHCGVFKAVLDQVTFYFIDNEEYFGRAGLYGYKDDEERFAFFDNAVLEAIGHLQLRPDIVHLHDWQTAMIAPLYKEKYWSYEYYENFKIVFTIHNIAYQGKCDPNYLGSLFGLDQRIYPQCSNDGCLNMMKAAIVYSDIVTTVSPTYAREILTPEYGEGLQYILNMRGADLYGILNGIDYDINDPMKDPHITTHFNVDTVQTGKLANKLALQKEVGLPVREDVPLIGIVTRLTWQKGIDLIVNKMEELMKRDVQVLVLGAGDRQYEEALAAQQKYHPDQLSVQLKYDFGLSCRIYAGCDMFLMPSLFEPCGLSQMMSLRYGTIPIVRETGGLKDSVIPYNEYEMTGTGFSFTHYQADEMMNIIDYALSIYAKKDHWNTLVSHAMQAKLDWENSAETYESVFEELLKK